mmetsp:Transcript_663/g.1882  ORF Transcript_663/g.1882 Transcript_663/m.1882 type:complete len:305 (-) Transcript_663:247-1161(-)
MPNTRRTGRGRLACGRIRCRCLASSPACNKVSSSLSSYLTLLCHVPFHRVDDSLRLRVYFHVDAVAHLPVSEARGAQRLGDEVHREAAAILRLRHLHLAYGERAAIHRHEALGQHVLEPAHVALCKLKLQAHVISAALHLLHGRRGAHMPAHRVPPNLVAHLRRPLKVDLDARGVQRGARHHASGKGSHGASIHPRVAGTATEPARAATDPHAHVESHSSPLRGPLQHPSFSPSCKAQATQCAPQRVQVSPSSPQGCGLWARLPGCGCGRAPARSARAQPLWGTHAPRPPRPAPPGWSASASRG